MLNISCIPRLSTIFSPPWHKIINLHTLEYLEGVFCKRSDKNISLQAWQFSFSGGFYECAKILFAMTLISVSFSAYISTHLNFWHLNQKNILYKFTELFFHYKIPIIPTSLPKLPYISLTLSVPDNGITFFLYCLVFSFIYVI